MAFSSECPLKCSFSCESSENLLPHKVQLNGFSSECPLKCSFSCESSENLLPHKVQLNGFSSECPLKYSFSCESSENLLPHKVQLNGFCHPHTVICRNSKNFFGAKITIVLPDQNFFQCLVAE